MKRRESLKTTGVTMAGAAAVAGVLADWANAAESKPVEARGLFESDNPAVLALAQRVIDRPQDQPVPLTELNSEEQTLIRQHYPKLSASGASAE